MVIARGQENRILVDMLETGIIDPKKVTRVAIENASSVAGMIITTDCVLVDIPENNSVGGSSSSTSPEMPPPFMS